MFFSVLHRLREQGFDDRVIKQLDGWLGTRRGSAPSFLSPLWFAEEAAVVPATAINLFAACTCGTAAILRAKFCLRCPVCDYPAGSYYRLAEVPEGLILCDACGMEVASRKEAVRIWFELVQPPEPQGSSDAGFSESGDNIFAYMDIDYGLQPDDLNLACIIRGGLS